MVTLKFPEIRGKNLKNLPFSIPNDLRSRLNILILPSRKSSKLSLTRWLSFTETLKADLSFLEYYQIRIFNKNLKVFRRYIDRNIRKSIYNKSNLERIIHYYQNTTFLQEHLELKDSRSIYIFLVNNKGEILWRAEGPYNLEKAQLLKQKIIEHMSKF